MEGLYCTSARLTKKGKKEFKFGRVDIRAKLPLTKGVWPALQMLRKDRAEVGWPACGEIDILERIGQELNKVHGILHWRVPGKQDMVTPCLLPTS